MNYTYLLASEQFPHVVEQAEQKNTQRILGTRLSACSTHPKWKYKGEDTK